MSKIRISSGWKVAIFFGSIVLLCLISYAYFEANPPMNDKVIEIIDESERGTIFGE